MRKQNMLDILMQKMEFAVERKYCQIKTNREISNNGNQAELLDRATFAGNAVASLVNSKEVFIDYVDKYNSSLTDPFKMLFDYLSTQNASEKDFRRAKTNLKKIKKSIC